MVKRNIISGLLLFSLSVLLGPYMTMFSGEDRGPARDAMATAIEKVDEALGAGAGDLASTNAKALMAQAALDRANGPRNSSKVAHAHGNLEGILNIVVGLFLGLVAVSATYRLAASWLLIVGSWLHGGALVLGNMGLGFMYNALTVGGFILLLGIFAVVIGVLWKGFKEA